MRNNTIKMIFDFFFLLFYISMPKKKLLKKLNKKTNWKFNQKERLHSGENVRQKILMNTLSPKTLKLY